MELDPATAIACISQSLEEEPELQEDAIKMFDRMASLFLIRIARIASEMENQKHRKMVGPDSICNALKEVRFPEYVKVFMEEFDSARDGGDWEDKSSKKKKKKKRKDYEKDTHNNEESDSIDTRKKKLEDSQGL
eukprot:TRINITY_DN47218_c3_g2_i1.p1 TRINITY_DN47218_c3_g2~~TRINITY_DN47218_c3_g2_i1.p1  ORF type:complete len:134 (+),score=26.92 TRINITY_DN47218_c3_g2_i1:208-609(+)